MTSKSDAEILAEAIGEVSVSFIGKDHLLGLVSQVSRNADLARVWVRLKDTSLKSQLMAIDSFAEVRDMYEGEIELDLRFGEPVGSEAALGASKTLVNA